MRFRNRTEAGQQLAERLRSYAIDATAVVLGLPRGGVVTAATIAEQLDLPLDVLIVRKLGTPWQPELAMGAIASGGVRVLNPDIVGTLHIPQSKIDEVTRIEAAELARREKLYRGDRPRLSVADRTVIVVDDGIATGSTMLAAIRCIRAQKPARIVIAVPVAPPSTCRTLESEADDVVCLLSPEPFNAVGEWYDDFSQVEDAEVVALLARAAARV